MRYLTEHFDKVLDLAITHLRLSVWPILIAVVIALPVGVLVHRSRIARRTTGVIAALVFTIPSLALFVVLPPILGTKILDEWNVIVALAIYAVALLVRTVPEALDSVAPEVLDAARATGYTPMTQVLKIELPLALPVLIANLRVVAVTNTSLVAVGSLIGIGGLGTLFTDGYQRDYTSEIIAGIIAVVVLAVLLDVALVIIGSILTPWRRAGVA